VVILNLMNKKRSPIKDGELQRQPGQYLRDKSFDLSVGYIGWLVMAIGAIVLAFLEWLLYFTKEPRHPWVVTTIAVVVVLVALWRGKIFFRDVSNYKLGRDGEIFVGQLLEGLRSSGFVPLHDVPCKQDGKKFNIDHVIIGPKGIFAIETKTWSKEGVQNTIDFTNDSLMKNGKAVGVSELTQSQMNGKWLKELLRKRTGEVYGVFPILTFPKWWIATNASNSTEQKYGVMLLSSNGIGKYLEKYPDILNPEQVSKLVVVLSAYVHEVVSSEEKENS
jgi:hypothetical protein